MRAASSLAVVIAGCGGPDEESPQAQRPPASDPPAAKTERAERPALPPRLRCAEAAGNCRSARGTVLYVEQVDPDGDGDAHFVLASSEDVTGPGISVIDVPKHLRPDPLPEAGDGVSAVGPVYRGSYGQRQIEAERLRVRRR